MKKNVLIIVLLAFTKLSFAQNLTKKISESEFSIGKILKIKSKILGEERVLNVYLPNSYSKKTSKKYPVIYLLDGSKDEDFIHVAGLVQFGSFPWIKMIPETIIVGISNVDRKRDFTYPSNNKLDQRDFPTAGKSEKFINFIEKELQPFVNSEFRTSEIKTIIGQSLGGLLATEILFKKSELFNNYVIVSPSLWWDDEKLLDFNQSNYKSHKNIYVAVGKEGPVMERTAKELFEKLNKHNKENANVYYRFFEDKKHADVLHEGLYKAFEKIFMKKEQKK